MQRARAALWRALVVFATLATLAEGGPRRRRRVSGKQLEDHGERLKWLLIAIFAPVVVWFVVSLAGDPALPGLIKRTGVVVRSRFATYLGPAPKYKRR